MRAVEFWLCVAHGAASLAWVVGGFCVSSVSDWLQTRERIVVFFLVLGILECATLTND